MKQWIKKIQIAFLILVMVTTSAPIHAEAEQHDLLASFAFKDGGSNGIQSASDGIYKTSSTFEAKGGAYLEGVSSNGVLSYWGWSPQNIDDQYWLLSIPTIGYENLQLSSQQTSSGSGPRDFSVQTSLDGATWLDIDHAPLSMVKESLSNPGSTLDAVKLPEDISNQGFVYIRWKLNSATSTSGDSIGAYGSNRFSGLKLSGTKIAGTVITEPTRDINFVPVNGAQKVSENAPIMIQFNNAVVFDESTVTLIGESGHEPGIVLSIDKDMMMIEHDGLNFGEKYTVRVDKNAVQSLQGANLVRDVSWSFTVQTSPYVPKLMNMTFADSPKTSMGFAWYTDLSTDTIVELTEADRVIDDVFPSDDILRFEGAEESVETFMIDSDRASGQKTTFISHKVKALDLKPGTQYRFRLGNGSEWTKIGSFTTDAAEDQPYHFIVGADSQASSLENFQPWADTFRKARSFMEDPKFLIIAGDLVDNGDLETHWQYMLGVAEDSLLHVPFVPVLGGHEVNDYDGDVTTDNQNFYNHFNLEKTVVEGTHEGSVYSFEYGDALYMVFNSQYEGALAANGKDIAWEDAEFRAQVEWMRHTVARSDKKWKFVTFHKSPYAAGDNSAQWEDERVQFYRQHLIPVFDELAIDMVFEAHDHMYMRSFQMFGNEVVPFDTIEKDADGNYINPKGTVYLMPNALGNKFYTKNNQHYVDENWNAIEIIGDDGKPIPYDDFFAAVDDQPFKKMFTDVGIDKDLLSIKSYTAAQSDEGAPGSLGNGLFEYDRYGIVRTDVAPQSVQNLRIETLSESIVLTWDKPSGSEAVRGFRVYEANDKVKTHWSEYVPLELNNDTYSLEIKGTNPEIKYAFRVMAVGTRISGPETEILSHDHSTENEPPSAPSNLSGKAISQYETQITWQKSPGNTLISHYNIYRDDVLLSTSTTNTYKDSGLDANHKYTYSVSAVSFSDLESLHSNTIDVTTLASNPGKTFPQHVDYVSGSIKPNHISQDVMDQTVLKYYHDWKLKYLKHDPQNLDQMYVWYSDGDPSDYEDQEVTVSEAHGYGMMINALMAGHDVDAQKDFDSMYRYFRAHPSEINPNLMAWQQALIDGKIVDINGQDSATDGDMDVAYSLILAHEQWGSDGAINYLKEARLVIDAIMESDVDQNNWTLNLADWANSGKYEGSTRPSDWMMQHLQDFRIVSGDSRWDKVIDKTYELSQHIYTNFSPNTGLLPDFIIKENGSYIPAPAGFLESENDGNYYYNSARTPWRLATDYLVSGESRAYDQLQTLNHWIKKSTNNDVNGIQSGFALDGTVVGDWQDLTFTAPFMVSAMISEDHQMWLNDLWNLNTSTTTDEEVYFGNNIRLLSLIVVSGNWFSPSIRDTQAPTEPVIHEAFAISHEAIKLSWLGSKDNMAVKTYHIYRDGTLIASSDANQYIDNQRQSDTEYNYWIVAEDTSGNLSKASNMRVVRTLMDDVIDPALTKLTQLLKEADLKHAIYYTEASWIPFESARTEAHDFINTQSTRLRSTRNAESVHNNLKKTMDELVTKTNTEVPKTEYPDGKLPSTGMAPLTYPIAAITLIALGLILVKRKKERCQ